MRHKTITVPVGNDMLHVHVHMGEPGIVTPRAAMDTTLKSPNKPPKGSGKVKGEGGTGGLPGVEGFNNR